MSISSQLSALTKNRFIRNVVMIGSGTALGQLVGVVVSPILTRQFSTADFGVLNVYESLVSMVLIMASLNYEYGIPIAEDDAEAANVLVLAELVAVGMSFLSALGMTLAMPFLRESPKYSVILPYAWLVPVGILLGSTYHLFSFWAIRKKDYKSISRTKVTQGVLSSAVSLGFGVLGSGPIGLLLGAIVGKAAGLSTLARGFLKNGREILASVSSHGLRGAASRYRKYPIFQTWGSLLNTLGVQVFPIFLAARFGPEVAGTFYLTNKVISIPTSLVATSIQNVFIGEVSPLIRTDPGKLRGMFTKITARMLLVGTIPVAILIFAGQPLFSFVFGQEWRQSGLFAQVMALSFLMKFASDSYINLALIERQGLSLLWSGMRFAFMSIGIGLTIEFDCEPFTAVMIYTAFMVVSYIVKYFLYLISLNQMVRRFDLRADA